MKILTVAVVILATTGTTSECHMGTNQSCWVAFRGLEVENGMVTDVVTSYCDNEKQPLSHVIELYLDYRSVSDEFTPLSHVHVIEKNVPTEKGVKTKVTGICLEGYYRTHYHVSGRGAPKDGGGPETSLPFEYEDVGWSKYFDVEDCRA